MNSLYESKKKELETVFNINVDGLAILDLDLKFLKTNQSYRNMLGYTKHELDTLSCRALTAPEDLERVEILLQEVIENGYVENFEKVCVAKDQRNIIVNISMALMPDGKCFLISARDITQFKHQETVIKEYLSIIDENIILFSTDASSLITEISSSFTNRLCLNPAQIMGKHFDDIISEALPPISIDKFTQKHKVWEGDLKLRNQDKRAFWLNARAVPRILNSENIGFTFICQDISDKKELEILSITDPLTKLFNRRHFESQFTKASRSISRNKNILSFLMLDIDHFKKFNDFYGHQAGDQALIELSKCLSNLFQRSEDSCFRIGGEEFVVLYKTDDVKNSIEYAKFVLHAIEALKIEHLENKPYGHLTSSMGLLLIDSPLQGNDLKEVYKEADELLYQAKSNGRNQVCFKVFLKMST